MSSYREAVLANLACHRFCDSYVRPKTDRQGDLADGLERAVESLAQDGQFQFIQTGLLGWGHPA